RPILTPKKLDGPVPRAAAALGLPTQQEDCAVETIVMLQTPTGKKQARALLDCGAQAFLLSHIWAKTHLGGPEELPRKLRAIDGHPIQSYGRHRLRVDATDANGTTRTWSHMYDAVEMDTYDVILGMPWLKQVNPV